MVLHPIDLEHPDWYAALDFSPEQTRTSRRRILDWADDDDALRTFGRYVVPPGRYFMMGDSRDNSTDSRFIGTVARDQIVGKAGAVIVSFDTYRYLLPRLGRIAHRLQFTAN